MSRSEPLVDLAPSVPEAADRRHRNPLAVVGPIPPPVTGRTVVTERLVEELRRANVALTVTDTAVNVAGTALRRKLRRAARLLLFALRVVRQTRRASSAYITVDASPGTIFTVLYALIARLNRTRVILHHHSYSYIARPTLAMRCLCRIAGRQGLHITPSPEMSTELRARYGSIEQTAVLSNAFAIDPRLSDVRRPADRRRLVLGHLSNLTVAKGTLTAIECFAELRRRGEPVELHLAGPVQEDAVARAVSSGSARFGDAFHYHGPLDGAGKRAFYSGIDVFLLPTTFRNEAQPLVILEALAAGVPVIAYGRASIPRLLDGGPGLAVPNDQDFRAAAVGQIVAWLRDPDSLQSAGAVARRRFAEQCEEAKDELAQLLAGLAAARARPLLFVGPIPPPVTGRTVVTGCVYRRLLDKGVPVLLANTAPRQQRPRRVGRFIAALYATVAAKAQRASSAYVVVDAGWGMYHTIMVAALARLLGLELFLHHHVYSYVRVAKFRMSLLARMAGPGASHVVLSDRMAEDLKRCYPQVGRSLVVGNFCFVEETSARRETKARGTLRIGHLGNLRIDKGLGRVRELAEALSAKGVPHEIHLAGPVSTAAAQRALNAWPESAAGGLRYWGPVYDAQKAAFFDAIDVFVFPSLYDNEAAPLVCIEAMAAGVPVIAFDVACIREILGAGGITLPRDADFATAAASILAEWAGDGPLRATLSERARRAYRAGLDKGEHELQGLIKRLCPLLEPQGQNPLRGFQAASSSSPSHRCVRGV